MNNLVSFTTPLMRQSVGFDRFNDLFETMLNDKNERFDAYPPYNIEKSDEDHYRVVMAVAGFSDKDIDITVEGEQLTVSGKIVDDAAEDEEKTYLHRGIATRTFTRTFRLADHIQVKEADMKDGLLTIDLERVVPEEKKPRMIPIKTAKTLLGGKKK